MLTVSLVDSDQDLQVLLLVMSDSFSAKPAGRHLHPPPVSRSAIRPEGRHFRFGLLGRFAHLSRQVTFALAAPGARAAAPRASACAVRIGARGSFDARFLLARAPSSERRPNDIHDRTP